MGSSPIIPTLITTTKKENKMGYYITTIDSEIFLDKKHFEDVYKKMCELNDFDDLKRGGMSGNKDEDGSKERYNKEKWFSWMEYNYPEIYSDMNSIWVALGFETNYDEDGNLIYLHYGDKTGSEDYFLSCLAGFVKEGSYVEFKGEEDGDYYQYVFTNGKMLHKRGVMTIDYDRLEPETYEFGKMSNSDLELAEWSKKWKAEREAQEIAKQNA
jgi:hypothetical protein